MKKFPVLDKTMTINRDKRLSARFCADIALSARSVLSAARAISRTIFQVTFELFATLRNSRVSTSRASLILTISTIGPTVIHPSVSRERNGENGCDVYDIEDRKFNRSRSTLRFRFNGATPTITIHECRVWTWRHIGTLERFRSHVTAWPVGSVSVRVYDESPRGTPT